MHIITLLYIKNIYLVEKLT